MARIVIIDDDESMRPMLAQMLARLGHEVFPAPDAKTGLRLVRESPPDLVITDIIMPEKDGVETIMELRRQHRGLKIIAMSGGGRVSPDSLLDIAKKLGAQLTLTKPFSRDELRLALESVLKD